MATDAWLPIGFRLPDGSITRGVIAGGPQWQIVETSGNGRGLIATAELSRRWTDSGLLELGQLAGFDFGDKSLLAVTCGPGATITQIADGLSPSAKSEALAFALALKATRDVDKESPLQDAIYVEKYGRLLPTYGITSNTGDDVVLGYWLTGGVPVSVSSFRRIHQLTSWLPTPHLRDIIEAAGFQVTEVIAEDDGKVLTLRPGEELSTAASDSGGSRSSTQAMSAKPFELPGRPELEAFFNEHVIDIIRHRARYKALGLEFPSAIVLHGPPGCGKTYAVEQLVTYLGWPEFQIDSSSIGSPYIHETSRKVSQVFQKAMDNAPSVLVIDEMEAFLSDRDNGIGANHRVEEVGEFLRRIPEAVKSDVLIIAMTNRIEMIDPAILRRGRFDHILKIDFASEQEVGALLDRLLGKLPKSVELNVAGAARQLAGRPLSDVAFVVREAARLAARAGKDSLDQESLNGALAATPAREREGREKPRIGFV